MEKKQLENITMVVLSCTNVNYKIKKIFSLLMENMYLERNNSCYVLTKEHSHWNFDIFNRLL